MKVFYIPLILMLVCIGNFVNAQSPNWQWAETINEIDGNPVLCTDAHGNCFFGGGFSYPPDLLLVKCDSSGRTIWDQYDIPLVEGEVNSVCTDAKGNCYVTGGDDTGGFVMKYDSLGKIVWSQSIGGAGVSADANGNCYITGSSSGFILKLDASGKVVWAKTANGGYGSYATGVVADAKGNSWITGLFLDSINFGGIILTNDDFGLASFVVKYDTGGNVLWAISRSDNLYNFGGPDVSVGNYGNPAISLDTNGNVYVVGNFLNTNLIFGNDTLVDYGAPNFYIVKYDPFGNPVWARSAPAYTINLSSAIITDAIGNSYIAGFFTSDITLGNTILSGQGQPFFVAKYNSSGQVLWAKSVAGTGLQIGYSSNIGIGIDEGGNAYVAGYAPYDTLMFDSIVLNPPANGAGIFVAKLSNALYNQITGNFCSGGTYNFDGRLLDTPGVYNDTLTDIFGNDSIVMLNLIKYHPVYDTVYANICTGGSYPFNGANLTQPGIYNAFLTSGSGCDSSVNLHLTINQPLEVSFSWDSMVAAGLLEVNYYGGDTSICESEFLLPLFGGNPPGGSYSGTYVADNHLNTNFYNVNSDTVTYTVTLYGCTASASDILQLNVCEGVTNFNLADGISLYPNPTGNELTLQSSVFTASNISPVLYDITGKLIAGSYTRQGNKFIYNTTGLAAGVYFIKVRVDGNEVVKRFVKVE